jgi:hypothetical protein
MQDVQLHSAVRRQYTARRIFFQFTKHLAETARKELQGKKPILGTEVCDMFNV